MTATHAIVTGASSGIGRAVAIELAAAKWSVLAVARRSALLEELRAEHASIVPFAIDLVREGAPEEVIAKARQAFGGLDLLINNAGAGWAGPFEAMPTAAIDAVLGLNLRALMLCCRAAVPELRKSGHAQIINVASVGAHVPMPGIAAYCAAKAAVVMFSRVLARELAADRIRVNAVSPEGTATDIFAKAGITIDPGQLIPPDSMARAIVALTAMPAGTDVGELIVQRRFDPAW